MVRPMVHSQKHYRQFSLATIAAGALQNSDIINAVNVVDKNTSSEVEEGSSVKAVYLELWINTNDTSPGTNIIIIEKQTGASPDATTTNMALLDSYPNKKNILYTTMGLTNPNTSTAIPALKFWLKIPKSKQRFGLGDKLSLTIMSQTGTIKFCGFMTYKEYK